MPFNQEEHQKKIDLLESNGFKKGDMSYPDDYTRIRSLDNLFHIKSYIPYYAILDITIDTLKDFISHIDEDNEYELNEMKANYIKEVAKNGFQ